VNQPIVFFTLFLTIFGCSTTSTRRNLAGEVSCDSLFNQNIDHSYLVKLKELTPQVGQLPALQFNLENDRLSNLKIKDIKNIKKYLSIVYCLNY
jgi:hypothetical protein